MPKSRRFTGVLLSLAAAAGAYFLLPADCPEAARRTAFVLVFAGLSWALELIPLYATSVAVVVGLILLLGRPGGVMDMDRTGYQVFLMPLSSPVIMLFFGGFILAAALRKYRADQWLAARLVKRFGTHPYRILLGFMLATGFLSMWLSNTATTAMMLAMVGPLLWRLDHDDPFRSGLALAIAFGANLGGVATPIGTPPNAIAMGVLAERGEFITFLSWMKMALPLALILIVAASLVLKFLFPSKHGRVRFEIESHQALSGRAKGVLAVAGLVICLWLTSGWHRIPEAVIALLAVAALTGLGFLDRYDFKNIDWDVLILMWGGLALGSAIEVSGLAAWILDRPLFAGQGTFLIVLFGALAVALSSFISNTATANLILPLAVGIPGLDPVMIAVVVALSCSFAMALPISTPPNAMVFATEAVSSRAMLRAGLAISAIAMLLVFAGFHWILPLTV